LAKPLARPARGGPHLMSVVVRGDWTAHEVPTSWPVTTLSRGPDGAAILIIHTVMCSDTIA